MTTESDWPQFEPEDADGFRSISLYTDGKLTYRISVHFGALREGLTKTAGDFNLYSKNEQQSMKAAAALLAAKVPGEIETDELTSAQIANLALTNMLQTTADFTPLTFEKFFPGLALRALEVASDVCVKKALNNSAQGFRVPQVTTEESVNIILDDFVQLIKRLLSHTGRPLRTPRLLQDVQVALRKVKVKPGKKPTQEQVAEAMEIDPRTLRKSMAAYGIKTWNELLLVCKYWEELNSGGI